jgi:hypothetical protein
LSLLLSQCRSKVTAKNINRNLWPAIFIEIYANIPSKTESTSKQIVLCCLTDRMWIEKYIASTAFL